MSRLARRKIFQKKFGNISLKPLTDDRINRLEQQKITTDLLRLNQDMELFRENISDDLKNFKNNESLTEKDKLKIATNFQALLSSFDRVIKNCLNNAEMPNLITKEVMANYKNETINRAEKENLEINKIVKKYIENNNNIKKTLNNNLVEVEKSLEKTKDIYPKHSQKIVLDKVKDYKLEVNKIGQKTLVSIQNWVKAFNQQNKPSTQSKPKNSQPQI